ncbi:MAG: NADH-quinone oxidoreductase subunit NuoE [Desulfobacteraceae bacterium]|jgi:NADH-quinone oxidoreductase subunit E
MTKKLRRALKSHQQDRDSLIPILQDVQGRFGYVSEEAVERIASYLHISESSIYGVATFYTQFRFSRPGDHRVKVCLGTACHVRGGSQIMDEVTRHLGVGAGETTPDYKFSLERVACFGSCALSPVVVMDDKVYGRMSPKKVKKILKGF